MWLTQTVARYGENCIACNMILTLRIYSNLCPVIVDTLYHLIVYPRCSQFLIIGNDSSAFNLSSLPLFSVSVCCTYVRSFIKFIEIFCGVVPKSSSLNSLSILGLNLYLFMALTSSVWFMELNLRCCT